MAWTTPQQRFQWQWRNTLGQVTSLRCWVNSKMHMFQSHCLHEYINKNTADDIQYYAAKLSYSLKEAEAELRQGYTELQLQREQAKQQNKAPT